MKENITALAIRRRRNILAEILRRNNKLPPEERATNSATLVTEGERMILIDGSAHEMEDLFIELLKERPEMRQVIQSALDKRFRIAMAEV